MIGREIKLEAKIKARDLRRKQTEAEKLLWNYIRNIQLDDIKFLRQHQIVFNYFGINHYYIADFYCAENKTIIEIDGEIHLKQKDKDEIRENILKELGYKIVRFKNSEVLNDIENVLAELKAKMLK